MKYVRVESASLRESVFTQYVDDGHIIRPAGKLSTVKELEPNVYTLNSDMQGFYLSPHELRTDALLRFKDKRQTLVLSEIHKFWGLKGRFNDLGFVHKRALLLYGAPGTGKSCVLKLVMGNVVKEDDVVLIAKSPNLLVTALDNIRQVEPNRRILATLEDVDEMVRYDEHALLGLFDGDSQQEGIILLGTTNYLDRLPPRMLRTGRFDRVIEIGNPGKRGRKAYFDSKLKGKEEDGVVSHLIGVTKGYNFSQLKEVLVSVYCLGYPLKEVLRRIKGGAEGINAKRVKYLDKGLEKLTTARVVAANLKGLI